MIELEGRELKLTNLNKLFWQTGISKRDLLQYYSDISPVLLPHLRNRAMVMKRYPNGAEGEFFFQKRIPEPHPEWVETCEILHSSGRKIRFPMIQDLPTLLWVVNLGCIDLNQWYATCDDIDRPDYLHFDLDPGPGATFDKVLETAMAVRSGLAELKISSYAKTSGSRGIHIYGHSARAHAEASMGLREGVGAEFGGEVSRVDYGGVSNRQTARETRLGGL